ncbi:MAG: hypothetical protein ABII74_03605 [Elusimicrobiota bacterium]
MAREKKELLKIYERLFDFFGSQRWWPAETILEVIVGAILTQNTAWSNVEKAIGRLKQDNLLHLDELVKIPQKKLEGLIHSSGFYRQKAGRLKKFVKYLKQAGREDWKKYFSRDILSLRKELLSQKGIGPETADSILLYAGHKMIFVVDAYTRRIGRRIGLFDSEDYHWVQNYFQDNLPKRVKLYQEYQALLVALGKNYCRSKPVCPACPLGKICDSCKV